MSNDNEQIDIKTDLHTIGITCLDGHTLSAALTMDGEPMEGVYSVKVEMSADDMVTRVTIERRIVGVDISLGCMKLIYEGAPSGSPTSGNFPEGQLPCRVGRDSMLHVYATTSGLFTYCGNLATSTENRWALVVDDVNCPSCRSAMTQMFYR